MPNLRRRKSFTTIVAEMFSSRLLRRAIFSCRTSSLSTILRNLNGAETLLLKCSSSGFSLGLRASHIHKKWGVRLKKIEYREARQEAIITQSLVELQDIWR